MSDEPRIKSGRDTIQAGGDVFQIAGDYVAGDKITYIVQRSLPVNLRTLVQPLIEHYAADVFGGRDAELAQLDTFLADPTHPFGLMVAPTGLGKTALLVHWIAQVQQQHPEWRIIFAPVSIRFQTANEQVALSILAHSLADIHSDLEQYRSYDQSPSNLRALIADYLRRPLPSATQLLLVLDGIDEATGWKVGPLCAVPPQAGLKIVVAARQRANATRDDLQHQLGWTTAPVAALDLGALERPAITALLRQSDPALAADPAFVEQLFRVSEGDPLTCNLLIKALSGGKIAPESLTQRPPGLEAFLKDWVEMLRKRRQASRPIRELLALCAAAYGPLTSDDLQALAPDAFVEQADIVDAVSDDDVARFIITVGEAQHTYVFSHQRLREVFLEQIYPPKDRERLQQRLIAYGESWFADRSQPLPDYLRQFWIAHLKSAGEWERMRRVLTEIVPSTDGQRYLQPWQTACYAAEGSDTGYLTDLDILWSWAEQQCDLELTLRCALIAASLRSRSGNLTPELLVQLLTFGMSEGRWSVEAVLGHVSQMSDETQQTYTLAGLPGTGIDLPWERILSFVESFKNSYNQAIVLMALAHRLPSSQLGRVLTLVAGFDDPYNCARVLMSYAPYLPEPLLARALEITGQIDNPFNRAQALKELIPYLSGTLLAQAQGMATQIDVRIYNQPGRLRVPDPPDSFATDTRPTLQKDDVYDHDKDELHIAYNLKTSLRIDDASWQIESLIALSPYLPFQQRSAAVGYALNAATQIDPFLLGGYSRAEALIALAPHLPESLLPDALTAASQIEDQYYRVRALIRLALRLPLEQQASVWTQAFAAATQITNVYNRVEVLTSIIPHLPNEQQATVGAQTLTAVDSIDSALYRAKALIALAPYLPNEQQAVVWAQARSEVDNIHRVCDRASTLIDLDRGFEEPFLPGAVTTVSQSVGQDRPNLSPQMLTDALAAARAIIRKVARARALAALAPHLAGTPACDANLTLTLRTCARRGRPDLLGDITALMPWLLALAERSDQPSMLTDLGTAIIETARCWP